MMFPVVVFLGLVTLPLLISHHLLAENFRPFIAPARNIYVPNFRLFESSPNHRRKRLRSRPQPPASDESMIDSEESYSNKEALFGMMGWD
jgi:hypothetical protein